MQGANFFPEKIRKSASILGAIVHTKSWRVARIAMNHFRVLNTLN